ncbi:MAG: hypothetical protein O7F12_06430, partial [Nitrospirae bacterium]|nr:hypothetical protein [Nitrospirota bacterium]
NNKRVLAVEVWLFIIGRRQMQDILEISTLNGFKRNPMIYGKQAKRPTNRNRTMLFWGQTSKE